MGDFQKVGVDVGSSSTKLVELAPAGSGRWRLLAAASVPTPQGGLMGPAGNSAVLSQAMAKVVKDIGVRSRRVVLALPEEQVSSHVVEMPLMSDEEIKQALAWQVEQYIPIPAEKAVWSHQIIRKDQSAGTMEVLLVAAAKNLVTVYVNTLEQVGFEVVAVETELMAVARAVTVSDTNTFLVVDIGSSGTDLGIVSKGQLVFARTIPTGGAAFTRAISAGLNLDQATAEQYKSAYGFADDKLKGELVKVMLPVLNTIALEVRKTADFYVSKHAGEQIRLGVLTGGESVLPEMVSRMSGMVGMEMVVGNPLSRVQLSSQQASAMEGTAQVYTVALGLAMRNC